MGSGLSQPRVTARLGALKLLVLALIALAAFAPGIATLPPIDRDEGRFVQATKQMLETDDYIDIRFQDESRYKKPVGIYWLQSAMVIATGGDETSQLWRYRLVSVAAGIASVLLAALLGNRMFGTVAGLAAGLMMAAMFGLAFEARIAKTDATLLAFTLAAQTALAHLYLGWRQNTPAGRGWWLAFWLAIACAVLIKGPITPIVCVLTIAGVLVFDKERGWVTALKPIAGLAVVLAVAAPWLIAITIKSDGAFWMDSLGQDMLGKVSGAQESHGAPPGTYILTYGLFLWPVGFLAVIGGLKALGDFRRPELLFCLSWYIPFWLVLEATPTKLPHYPLPAYPALILLGAWALFGDGANVTAKVWQVWVARLAQAGIAIVSILLAAAAIGIPIWLDGAIVWMALPTAIAALVTGWLAAGFMLKAGEAFDFPLKRLIAVAIGAICTHGLLFAVVAPSLTSAWTARNIAAALAKMPDCKTPDLASVDFHEPSLVFLTQTATQLTDLDGAADHLSTPGGCAVASVPATELDALHALLPPGAALIEIARFDSFNYSKGRKMELVLVRRGAR
jgi:4-amino-4-deoxy-L-arabinose transferase-like glycosyltransferase